jgi:hypothetical protein
MPKILTEPTEQQRHDIEQSLKAVQELGIHVEAADRVAAYLQKHLSLASALSEIMRVIAQQLPDAALSLAHYVDPEIEDEFLIVYARFAEYDKTVQERIRKVRDAYRHLLPTEGGWLLLTTDYRPAASEHVQLG